MPFTVSHYKTFAEGKGGEATEGPGGTDIEG